MGQSESQIPLPRLETDIELKKKKNFRSQNSIAELLKGQRGGESIQMAEPTVTVVIKRIRSIVDEETEILGPVKDKFAELLSKTENLTSYLNCADENTLLTETATKYENATDQFIYKVTSESRGSCSFLRRYGNKN